MRKLNILIFILTNSIFVFAQSSYADIQKQVKLAMASYNERNSNYVVLNRLVASFERSKKIKDNYLEKDNLGIAFFLSEKNPELDIFPARYTFANGKINLSALRNKDTKKPSEEMREYVKTYIEDFNHLNNTIIFKKMIYNAPNAEGTITSNDKEQMISEPYATSFIRGNDTWMYAMSSGNQGIILYAFKMKISGENLSEKRKY